jgi:RES domain
MEGDLPSQAGGVVYRVGRKEDPWAWPDWSFADTDGTFGNRWDDPRGQYRVLYASTSRLGAYVEVLSRFRHDEGLTDELDAIGPASEFPPSTVPPSWYEERLISRAVLSGSFADIGTSQWISHLNQSEVKDRVVGMGFDEIDASVLRVGTPRRVTQEISRYVYDLSTPYGLPRFAGITYGSRYGDDFRNWAVFEPASPHEERPFHVVVRDPVRPDDSDFKAACELLNITY